MTPEERIKEQRLIEATKKKLIGASGKLGLILKYLGQPIVHHSEGGTFVDRRYLGDWYDEEDDPFEPPVGTHREILEKIPLMAPNHEMSEPEGDEWFQKGEGTVVVPNQIGWMFDGLSRGMHFELKYIEAAKELTASYRGYPVFREVRGDLKSYVPHAEWERWVDDLFKVASKIKKDITKQDAAEQKELVQQEKSNWLQRMREKWGI